MTLTVTASRDGFVSDTAEADDLDAAYLAAATLVAEGADDATIWHNGFQIAGVRPDGTRWITHFKRGSQPWN